MIFVIKFYKSDTTKYLFEILSITLDGDEFYYKMDKKFFNKDMEFRV